MSKMPSYTSTTNACKLCRPLGAALAFRGIEGGVPFLHGSQGCATYMRRYIISHYNEPIDIASSALGEKNAIFGGGPNLKLGLKNVIEKYQPQLIGIATTCLTETIGDDVTAILKEFKVQAGSDTNLPHLVHVASPSYSGSHMEGFHDAVLACLQTLTEGPANQTDGSDPGLTSHRIGLNPPSCEGTQGAADGVPCAPLQGTINLLPGFMSPADLRYLKEVLADFELPFTLLPDISETLDGPALSNYPLIPAGGTSIAAIKAMGTAAMTIEFGYTLAGRKTAGTFLDERFGIKLHRLGMPIGIRETDRFLQMLDEASGRTLPERHAKERGRLVDALVDGHKYLAGKTAVVYGEEDLVVGLTAFLVEIGVKPVLCASGGNSGNLEQAVNRVVTEFLPKKEMPQVAENVDFHEIGEQVKVLRPDLLIGHSKGYSLARKMNIPLIRVGFPIHDRLGGQRILHLGYRGAQQLFDILVNTVIAAKQEASPVGYSYM